MKQKSNSRIRPCPLCFNKKVTVLYKQKFAGGIRHIISFCISCGMVFVSNAYKQEYYNEYYRESTKYDLERGHGFHEKYAEIIKKFIPKTAAILDIGCSTGHLLFLLKKAGYGSLLGMDPSPECQKIGKREYGLKILTGTLDQLKSNKKYDLIILAAVLEHIENPKDAIRKAMSILKKDGYLFIAVPDAGRFFMNVEEPFGEFSTEHINFFSESYLYRFLPNFSNIYMSSDDLCIYSLWKKGSDVADSVNKYIQVSNKKMIVLNKKIDLLPSKIIVWGVGALTKRLLETTSLGNKVFLFVDKSKSLSGSSLNGISIISPEELKKYTEPILLSTYTFQDEMMQYIRNNGLKNKVYLLK